MNFNFIYRAAVAAALMAAPLTAAADLLPGFVFMGTDTGAAQSVTYLSVNAQGRTFAELRIEFFDNELSLNPIADIDLLPLLQHNGPAAGQPRRSAARPSEPQPPLHRSATNASSTAPRP